MKSKIDIDNMLYTGVDWAKTGKDQELLHRITLDMMRAEMLQSRFNTEHHSSNSAEKWAEMVPVHKRGVDLSLPGIISSLSHANERYFTLEDGYGPDSNPFESMNRFTGHFGGLQVEQEGGRSAWDKKKHRVTGMVSLPSGTPWPVFHGLSRFVDRHHRPHDSVKHPPRGGFLLHLLEKYGWFDRKHTDVFFQANIEAAPSVSWQNLGGRKYSDYGRYEEPDWNLTSCSMHIGPWRFEQDTRLRSGSFQGVMRSIGWSDQIVISKERGKQMESIILYLDTSGRGEALWEPYREEELRSHIDGDTWTENDLRLLEMLDLRDEVFLDKPEQFPILSGIGRVTEDFVRSATEIRRFKIFDTFGKGTIKRGDLLS
ncbi:hypothetical protein pEaSNUABM55_00236 [Erwinia phage pEa_SNUABM_55]|nr:hypothetical protein pEaSNUABM55_00236 [Erwinia phage pEa_SNUABM_55]